MNIKNLIGSVPVIESKGRINISPEQWFMISALVVNIGNYGYNLVLGRMLGPVLFAEASLIVTMLLMMSFLAMTLQLAVAKFEAAYDSGKSTTIRQFILNGSIGLGVAIGIIIWLLAPMIASLFQSTDVMMFRLFSICVPLYLVMSVRRGVSQGRNDFIGLSISYQAEMWGRLILTIGILLLTPVSTGTAVVLGIIVSLALGMLPSLRLDNIEMPSLSQYEKRSVLSFMLVTGLYEVSQIAINNTDILMVKHWFDAESAGFYSALALIGRAVYYVAWMFIMLLLPKVVKMHKNGENTQQLLASYVRYTVLLCGVIITLSYLIPQFIVISLFGHSYLAIADHLWIYAMATSMFALSNIYTYYALSLERYIPTVITIVFGCLQIGLIILYHQSLLQVVIMQLIAMTALLASQLSYYYFSTK